MQAVVLITHCRELGVHSGGPTPVKIRRVTFNLIASSQVYHALSVETWSVNGETHSRFITEPLRGGLPYDGPWNQRAFEERLLHAEDWGALEEAPARSPLLAHFYMDVPDRL